jgi:hypothetical protein
MLAMVSRTFFRPCACATLLVVPVAGQGELYGITDDNSGPGKLVAIDPIDGSGTTLWTLPSKYTGCDSLVFVDGYFYASYGAFAGGAEIVRFELQPDTAVDFGPTTTTAGSPVYSIEDITRGPDGTLYAAYNDSTPNPPSPANKVGVLTLAQGACTITPLCTFSGFGDVDALASDTFERLWIANLQDPSKWGYVLLESCQTVEAGALSTKTQALVARGQSAAGLQEFYATASVTDFAPSQLLLRTELGDETVIGDVGLGAVTGLTLVPMVSASYCTAGTTTNGCTARLFGHGRPTAAATSGFVLTATGVEGQKLGLIFYGVTGPKSAPWGNGSSFLCVAAPVSRTPSQDSGGTSGACDGTLSVDFLDWVANHPAGVGVPFMAGNTVWSQAWFRDPPAPKGTSLSDGLSFIIAP